MSVLSVLSGLATTAGKGFEGYALDRQTDVKNAMAQANAAREAERARMLNLLTQRDIATPRLGDPGYAAAQGAVAGAQASARIPAAVAQAKELAPIQTGVHATNRQTDVDNPLPVATTYTPVTLGGENGQPPVVKPFNNRTGTVGAAVGDAKPTGTTGNATLTKARAANVSQLAIIEDALKELDKAPGAVGLLRGLPVIGDRLDPRADPAGVAARAQIANIGSLKIHDRSGAAVAVTEFPRLAPFIPSITDPPDAIRVKLGKLRDAIMVETEAMGGGDGASASAAKPSITAVERDALKAQGFTDQQITARYTVAP